MKIVIGLGNPGRKYVGTRHNVGFKVIEELARRHAAGAIKSSFQANVADVTIAGDKVLLVEPQTFMNASGITAVLARDFYKLAEADLLVVCDDFALPLGRLRIRPQGSAGGQKGLVDIMPIGYRRSAAVADRRRAFAARLGCRRFCAQPVYEGRRTEIDLAIVRAADAVHVWIRDGIAATE